MGYDEQGALSNFGDVPKGHTAAGYLAGFGFVTKRNAKRKAESEALSDKKFQQQVALINYQHQLRTQSRAAEISAQFEGRMAEREHRAAVQHAAERMRAGLHEEQRDSAEVRKNKASRMAELEKERPSFVGSDSSATIGATVTTQDTPEEIASRNAAWQEARKNA